MAKNAIQRGRFIGRLTYAKKGEIQTTKNGKEKIEYNFGIKLHNGVSIFTKSTLWNPKNPADYTQRMMDMYEELIDISDLKEEKVYVQKTIRPSKDKQTKEEKMSFEKFKGYYKKDGTIAFGAEGNIDILSYEPAEKEGEEDIITVPGYKDDKETPFSEIKNYLNVEMVIQSINEKTREVVLYDGTDGDYPLTLIGYLHEDMPIKGAKIGQGYKFKVDLVKGAFVQTATNESDDIWETEAKKGGNFEADKLIFTPTGKIVDLVSQDAQSSKGSKVDSLPF